jgi:hypothetical protein
MLQDGCIEVQICFGGNMEKLHTLNMDNVTMLHAMVSDAKRFYGMDKKILS